MKITVEIDVAELISDLEDSVPNPTGGKEDEASIKSYVEEYDSELNEVVSEWLLNKLIDYHTH